MAVGALLGGPPIAPLVAAILVLGGEPERDFFAVELAQRMVGVDVYVSSPGGGAEQRFEPLAREGRLHLSWDAVDTVTNFSTLYQALLDGAVRRVLLVTSPYHMSRGLAVGRIMLAAGGIEVEPWPVPGGVTSPVEARWRIVRDEARAWIWRWTGFDFLFIARIFKRFGMVRVFGVCAIAIFVLSSPCWTMCVLRSRRRNRVLCGASRQNIV
eukprot:TRINITY_DN60982_c0_g1_i1.p1 TRINITY_DN60982_c0_g1~~TRINITY_DN60982_c0_g1_i1.p1  ORF type:complete len:212 (-),score=18.71 TRINITY_DN60982_c0_g1_i1:48-683(-)